MVNTGIIDTQSKTFTKKVVFSKAVLWKDRQLSIPKPIMDRILSSGITKMEFVDATKNEVWSFPVEKVQVTMILKQVGQEPQYYFPIGTATKRKLIDDTPVKPETKQEQLSL